MFYAIAFVIGLATGSCVLILALWYKFQIAKDRQTAADEKKTELDKTSLDLQDGWKNVNKKSTDLDIEIQRRNREHEAEVLKIHTAQSKLDAEQSAFQSRVISFKNLQDENSLLKRDLHNIDVSINRLTLDRDLLDKKQQELDERSVNLAKRFLNETVKSVSAAIGANNYSACKQRLLNAIQSCRDIGFSIPVQQEEQLLGDLKVEFGKAVKAEFEREEQARIKARIREEERVQREIDQELKRLDRERAVIQAALDRALAEASDKHSEEIQLLQARLAEAEEKSKRALSMAQLTKAGHVYVISNIGSFGENVYKIGMTRRLMPKERIKELSGAAVPFPFDVHLMINCENAPALENSLHRELHGTKINKTNPRKEFFKTDLEAIIKIVRANHGDVEYIADAEALQYRQSINMSAEDSAFIEQVYNQEEEEEDALNAIDNL